MVCSVITKNSNWEILTKNLVLLNDGVEEWKTLIFLVSQKNLIYRGDGVGGGNKGNNI